MKTHNMTNLMRQASHGLCAILMLGCVGALTACAGIVTPPPNFTLYDLDTNGDPISFASTIIPHSVDVKAPSWLNNAAMQYRLDYLQPSSRAVYGESRWVAHPQELIQRSLSSVFMLESETVSACRLRLDLDEFIQRFQSADNSYAEWVIRASLLSPREEAVLARKQFLIRTPAQTADASGGVVAHRQSVRVLAQSLADWLDQLDDSPTAGLNVGKVCQR